MNDVCNIGPIAAAFLLATPLPPAMAVKIKAHIKSLRRNLNFLKKKLSIGERDCERLKRTW